MEANQRQDNTCRARADLPDGLPPGLYTCGHCGRTINSVTAKQTAYPCNITNCSEVLCSRCFVMGMPRCELCGRIVCHGHAVSMGDVTVCTECAQNTAVLRRELVRITEEVDREELRHAIALKAGNADETAHVEYIEARHQRACRAEAMIAYAQRRFVTRT